MKLLIDTNIVIDVLQKREPWFSYSYRILERCISGIDEGFLSAHSLSDIFFIVRKSHSEEARKAAIVFLCTYFSIIPEDKNAYLSIAQNSIFEDLEDGLQIYDASHEKLDYIITRNVKDFLQSPIQAIEPKDFLSVGH